MHSTPPHSTAAGLRVRWLAAVGAGVPHQLLDRTVLSRGAPRPFHPRVCRRPGCSSTGGQQRLADSSMWLLPGR